ncbi:response regulator transcription factor [soil metagenome]
MAKQRTTPTATKPEKRAKVFLVDDHAIVRQGLAELINDQSDLITCGEADSPSQAMKLIAPAEPDLAVLDITLNGGDGIELCRQLKETHPKLAILMLSMHDETMYAERALRAGAMGYVMKQAPQETVMAAIRKVLGGQMYLSDAVSGKLLRSFGRPGAGADVPPLERLSDRELQIFQMIGQGRSVRDIAEALFLSPKTVETHKEHIKQKLNLSSSNDLLRYAIESRMSGK